MLEILNEIKSKEGEDFTYDESALIEAYDRAHAEPESLVIKILSIAGGLLATLAFLGFLLIGGLYDSEVGLVSFGVSFVLVAIWLNRNFEKLILDTISVSLYVLGFTLFIMGFSDAKDEVLALMCLVIGLGTLWFMQNYMLAFLATLAVNASLFVLIVEIYDSPNALHVFAIFSTLAGLYWMLNEPKLITINKRLSRLYYPVRIGLIVSLLTILITLSFGEEWGSKYKSWFSSLVIISAAMYVVWHVLQVIHTKNSTRKVFIMVLSCIGLAPAFFAPYLAGSILVMLLCYLVNYRTGLVFSIIAFIYSVSRFYYDLNYTLLHKSILLIVSGVILLGLYFFFVHKTQTAHEAD